MLDPILKENALDWQCKKCLFCKNRSIVEIVIKYNRPTPYDHAECGQIWAAKLTDKTEHYINTGDVIELPHWVELGAFLKKVALEYAPTQDWDLWMSLYKHTEDKRENN